jgi:acetoin utilization deacetylase AcuC-like enzyme
VNAWFSDTHRLHSGLKEFSYGEWLDGFELPVRAEAVKQRFIDLKLGPVLAPPDLGLAPLEAVHGADYLHFLQRAWPMWTALGRSHPALPMIWRAAAQTPDRLPRHIDGQLGYFAQDAECSIVEGTWTAVYWSAQCALAAAADLLAGTRCSFAICRPPGHHATARAMGGFCYLNNVAIAAQRLLDDGLQRVAVVDVDYHHGNGTQAIFWERGDVLFTSLHGDPHDDYPFFTGHADEVGAGAGLGCNLNLPLPPGTDGAAWLQALDVALARVAAFGAQAVLVSLGVDTFEKDPISAFRLRRDDFPQIGRRIAALGLPTGYVFEGGYATAEVGTNTVGVLQGHLAAA